MSAAKSLVVVFLGTVTGAALADVKGEEPNVGRAGDVVARFKVTPSADPSFGALLSR